MFKHLCLIAALLLFFSATTLADEPETSESTPMDTYTNPLGIRVADPDVLLHDGVYYVYGTSAPDGFKVWSSTDLANWEEQGYAFQRGDDTWGHDLFWAPCIVEHDGAFYLFYNARGPITEDRRSHRICVARADHPLGPFEEVAAPLFDPGTASIDADVFIDDDGQAYLYYVHDISENPQSHIYVVPLADDLLSVTGEPEHCIGPSQAWEGEQWNEAPYVFRHEDTYILMYSAQGFYDPRYSVGYATAPSPTGPWTKAEHNPILHQTEHIPGPGHNAIAPSPDGSEMFIVYHIGKRVDGQLLRELGIDRMNIETTADGSVRLSVEGPTHEPQPLPSGAETATTGQ